MSWVEFQLCSMLANARKLTGIGICNYMILCNGVCGWNVTKKENKLHSLNWISATTRALFIKIEVDSLIWLFRLFTAYFLYFDLHWWKRYFRMNCKFRIFQWNAILKRHHHPFRRRTLFTARWKMNFMINIDVSPSK